MTTVLQVVFISRSYRPTTLGAAAYLGRGTRYRGHLPFKISTSVGIRATRLSSPKRINSYTNAPKRAGPRYNCSLGIEQCSSRPSYSFPPTPLPILLHPPTALSTLHFLLLLTTNLLFLTWIFLHTTYFILGYQVRLAASYRWVRFTSYHWMIFGASSQELTRGLLFPISLALLVPGHSLVTSSGRKTLNI